MAMPRDSSQEAIPKPQSPHLCWSRTTRPFAPCWVTQSFDRCRHRGHEQHRTGTPCSISRSNERRKAVRCWLRRRRRFGCHARHDRHLPATLRSRDPSHRLCCDRLQRYRTPGPASHGPGDKLDSMAKSDGPAAVGLNKTPCALKVAAG